MAMTFGTLQTMVSYIVDDLSFGYFTPAQVQFWLNNGQREVQKRLLQTPGNWYVKRVSTATVQNQSDYVLPNDFLKVHRVELVLSGTAPNEIKGPIEFITPNESDQLPPGPGTPSCAYILQNVLSVFPAADTAGQTLRIFYSYLVADMVNTGDMPDVPYQYEELIGLLAARDAFIKDQRDPTPLDAKIAVYDALMKQDAEQRQVTRGRQIVSTQGESWYTAAY
jgi:hypothetical protein